MTCKHPRCSRTLPDRNREFCSRYCYADFMRLQKIAHVCDHGYARGCCWRCRPKSGPEYHCGHCGGKKEKPAAQMCRKCYRENQRLSVVTLGVQMRLAYF